MIIKLDTSVSAWAIKFKKEQSYFLWLVAKEFSNGSGVCKISLLKKEFITLFGTSNKTFYNYINNGNDVFWSLKNGKIYLHSIQTIIDNIGQFPMAYNTCFKIDLSDPIYINIPIKTLLISCIVSSDKYGKPISLSYIAKILGISKSTVKRHISNLLIKKRYNYLPHKYHNLQFWNSYQFLGGDRLPSSKDKKCIKKSCAPKTSDIKLRKHKYLPNKWEILTGTKE